MTRAVTCSGVHSDWLWFASCLAVTHGMTYGVRPWYASQNIPKTFRKRAVSMLQRSRTRSALLNPWWAGLNNLIAFSEVE